jgi:hypothetical protein
MSSGHISGGVDFSDGSLLDLRVSGPESTGDAVILDLSRHISSRITHQKFNCRTNAPLLSVNGPATLGGVTISNTLNLENASFQTLSFGTNTWPTNQKHSAWMDDL